MSVVPSSLELTAPRMVGTIAISSSLTFLTGRGLTQPVRLLVVRPVDPVRRHHRRVEAAAETCDGRKKLGDDTPFTHPLVRNMEPVDAPEHDGRAEDRHDLMKTALERGGGGGDPWHGHDRARCRLEPEQVHFVDPDGDISGR